MSSEEFSPDPYADSYYARLDISPNANKKTIRRAGKLASRRYHPDSGSADSGQEAFIRIKKARETLQDDHTRSDYRVFCQKLGNSVGTLAFEKWQRKDRPTNPVDWVENQLDVDSLEDSGKEDTDFKNFSGPEWEGDSGDDQQDKQRDNQRDNHNKNGKDSEIIELEDTEKLRISSEDAKRLDTALKAPKIVWKNFDDDSVNVNHWTRGPNGRLYINSLLNEDFYIDLHTGEILTDGGEIPDIQISFSGDLNAIFISSEDRSIKIGIVGDDSQKDTNKKNRQRDSNDNDQQERQRKQNKDDDSNDKDDSQPKRQKYKVSRKQRLENKKRSRERTERRRKKRQQNSGRNRDSGSNDDGWDTEKLDRLEEEDQEEGQEEDQEEDPFEELKFWQNISLFNSFSIGSPLNWIENTIIWILTPYYLLASFIPKSRIGRGLLFIVWLALFPTPFDGFSLRGAFAIAVAVPFPSFGPYALAILALFMVFDSYPMVATIQVVIGFLVSLGILGISKYLSDG